MKQIIEKLSFNTKAENVLEITNEIFDSINSFNLCSGLINLSVLHTSCSLMVQENADSSVLLDIKNFLNKIAPECDSYNHSTEGPDDMPAHLKTLLTQTNITLSLKKKNCCRCTQIKKIPFGNLNILIKQIVDVIFKNN